MNPSISYAPGESLALIAETGYAVLDLRLTDPRVAELWAAAAKLDDLIDVLVRDGIRNLPSFACVTIEGDAIRYAVKGEGRIALGTDDTTTLTDTGAGGWSGGEIPSKAVRLVLTVGDTPGSTALPARAGVVGAASLTVVLDASAAIPAWVPEQVVPPSPPAPIDPDPKPVVDQPGAAALVDAVEPTPDDPAAGDHAAMYLQLLTANTEDRSQLIARLQADNDEAAEPESVQEASLELEPPADATISWTDEDAVPIADEPAAEQVSVPERESSGVIDGLPWLTPGPTSQPSPVVTAPPPPVVADPPPAPLTTPESTPISVDEPEDTQATLGRAALLQELDGERILGPSVFAVRCVQGHMSPPFAAVCRICGAHLPEQEPFEIARPPLGRLVLSNGSTVTLDKGVVFGRSPQSDETAAADRPHLVRLSESREISRLHASITLAGWQVLLRDLGSANHTFLTLPGSTPEQLRAHEDYVLEAGSEISLADVVTCRYEVS